MNVVKKIYQYADPNLELVGWMGFFGFPAYFYIWSYMYPQPYENAPLRFFCALLLLGLALRKYTPPPLKRYLPYYYLVTITICLPFFFSFMMFMNEWSTVWAMSFMSSIFLHVLLVHETRVMLLQAMIAIVAAYLFSYGLEHAPAKVETEVVVIWPYIPIFLFTYVFGNLFYFRNQVEHESKVSIAKSFGAGIAHEMRNPLSALKASVDVLDSSLPSIKTIKGDKAEIDKQDIERMKEVLSGADEVIRNGNEAIDLLLTSIDQSRVSHSTFRSYSVEKIARESLASFSYPSDHAKQVVNLHVESDFDYFGSDTLLKYALYNLLKNSLYYQNGEEFKIAITIRSDHEFNYLYFEDNGIGIEKDKLEFVFKDFYTSGKSSSYGLGLPFCKRVMHAFGGRIKCESVLGEWTRFTLKFPRYESQKVTSIKQDILRTKSMLYVGDDVAVKRKLNEFTFYTGALCDVVDFEQARAKEEFEFEYDLILLDLETCSEQEYLMLESKLHFTEAKIVMLFAHDGQYHNRFSRFLTFYPKEKAQFLLDVTQSVDSLMFGNVEPNRNLIPKKAPAVVGKRILIADDNESMRQLTTILLNKQGYQVSQAGDGNEVLSVLSSEQVDLILMDLEMPMLDGLETTTLIRESEEVYANVPILGHTGDNRKETLTKIDQAGMNGYLIKPVDKVKLLDKVADYI
ncbi:hybrid sensor histidine kinase/response regulator [Vibrio europaeus]|uniref:hybrid sensor histidine kinase/response regulator n=1 Tax=Vibrio europaeus TaxID=300876 RepID=UPI00148C7084|nr:hybrid sensor histidine kinase/response regulator [Vibrio europaeus]MDC5850344.1 hybrid sensor histidine kinase/response regulator [Vibrio europaeus]NOH25929.1 hybrid sensor histidine kinase/response regulator [Vibrio europaeus]